MDNQHRKISGYRELSQEEVDLMNRIKAKGAELLALQAEVTKLLTMQSRNAPLAVHTAESAEEAAEMEVEVDRITAAEPQRWAAIGKTDIQTGIMALVRAVAQPAGV